MSKIREFFGRLAVSVNDIHGNPHPDHHPDDVMRLLSPKALGLSQEQAENDKAIFAAITQRADYNPAEPKPSEEPLAEKDHLLYKFFAARILGANLIGEVYAVHDEKEDLLLGRALYSH